MDKVLCGSVADSTLRHRPRGTPWRRACRTRVFRTRGKGSNTLLRSLIFVQFASLDCKCHTSPNTIDPIRFGRRCNWSRNAVRMRSLRLGLKSIKLQHGTEIRLALLSDFGSSRSIQRRGRRVDRFRLVGFAYSLPEPRAFQTERVGSSAYS